MIGRFIFGARPRPRLRARTFDLAPHPQTRTARFDSPYTPAGGTMASGNYAARLFGLAGIGGGLGLGAAVAQDRYIHDPTTRQQARARRRPAAETAELRAMRRELQQAMDRELRARTKLQTYLALSRERVRRLNDNVYYDEQEGMR